MTKRPKRPRDFAQLAKLVVDIATGAAPRDPKPQQDTPTTEAKRRGGLKGGAARAKKLPARKRKEIARRAALARWNGQRSAL